jgi:hypothetical protein
MNILQSLLYRRIILIDTQQQQQQQLQEGINNWYPPYYSRFSLFLYIQ